MLRDPDILGDWELLSVAVALAVDETLGVPVSLAERLSLGDKDWLRDSL